MTELNLEQRVAALHSGVRRGGFVPGDCHCDECVETMDLLKQIDKMPAEHLLKFGPNGWAMEHPLSCRLKMAEQDKTLHDCEEHIETSETLSRLNGRPPHLREGTHELVVADHEGKRVPVVRRTDEVLVGGVEGSDELHLAWELLDPDEASASMSFRSPGT